MTTPTSVLFEHRMTRPTKYRKEFRPGGLLFLYCPQKAKKDETRKDRQDEGSAVDSIGSST